MTSYLKRYLFLEQAAAECTDSCVYKKIMDELGNLKYYYLTPQEKQFLAQRQGPQFLDLEITEKINESADSQEEGDD